MKNCPKPLAIVTALVISVMSAKQTNAQITIQLPTVSVFNVNTVVSVPDGGTISMGGVNRYSSGQISRGVPGGSNIPYANRLFRNRSIGSTASSTGSNVSVQIISLNEMEDQLLASRRGISLGNPNGTPETRKKADFLSRHMGRSKKR